MAEGSISFSVDLDVDKAEQRIAMLKSSIKKVEAQLENKKWKKSSLEIQADKAKEAWQEANDVLKAMREELENASSDPSRYVDLKAAIDEQIPLVDKLKKEFEKAQEPLDKINADYQAQVDYLTTANMELEELQAKVAQAEAEQREIAEAERQAAEEAERQAEAERQVAEETERVVENVNSLDTAFSKAGKSASKFFTRLKRMASRVLIFSVITAGLREIRNYLSGVLSKNEEFQKSFAQLKAASMTLFQPIIEYFLPKVISLIQYLTRAFMTLASLVTRLFGTTVEQAAASAKAISKVADESDKATSSLAGFDQINTISTEKSSSGTSAYSGDNAPDFAGIIGQELSEIEAFFTGLALVALGCILAFSGANIPIGIALMVAGAVMVYTAVTEDWRAIKNKLDEMVEEIVFAGVALVVIGLLCLIAGKLLLGISLIAMGAFALGYELTANWDAVAEMLRDPLKRSVALIAGAVLIVIGIIAAIGGNWLVAIPAIAIGAGFIIATIAANWDAIKEKLQGPIGAAVALISGALLVLGIILMFVPGAQGLALGLILAGAAGLAAVIYANWDFIVDKIKSMIAKAKDAIGNALNWVKDKFTALKDWLFGIFSKIGDFFSNIFGGIGDFFGGIWDSVTSWFSIDGAGTPIMPVPDVGNIGIPLAEGGLVPPRREFLALLGDNKSEYEVVSPVSTMKQAIKDALMEFGGMSGGDIHITVELDGRVVAKNTVKHVNRMTREAGKPVLIG